MALVRHVLDRYGDVLLAAFIVVLGLLQTIFDNDLSTAEIAANVVIAVGLGVLLAFRRRIPLLLLTLMFATALLEPLVGESGNGEFFGLFVLVVIYTSAAHTEGRRMWLAGAMTVVFGLVVAVNDPESLNVGAAIFFGMLFGVPWTVGRMVHHRRKREIALEERADALEREQDQRARVAVAEERQRIARELHDVVAHAISVIVVQARGGRRMLDAEPAEARGAFDTIERTGQEALGEMRRLLGLLRESEEEVALAPQPTLARLDELVGQVRDAGLPVELAIEGHATELPPGVDLSAYRIVQEALTNALKHAGPATARVTIRYAADNLELEIADDGSGSGGNGTGHGLVGIKERVAMLGGELETGGRPAGGYTVRARLPYASER
jgi:signal transduction histidine kinase